ncbi:hypothetical protein DIPPA_01505 [Diplonema papillatum]|nr:hypothetical protein DIPPA_01505 [Diplonema papillatum]|eukprot:gene23219-35580_t
MNAINRKLINPKVKAFFQRRDVGVMVTFGITAGTVAVSGCVAHRIMKRRLGEDYHRNRLIDETAHHVGVYSASRSQYSATKDMAAGISGTAVGFAFGAFGRWMSRMYLRQHCYTPLRELLRLHTSFYMPCVFLASLAGSWLSIRTSTVFYEWYPHRLDNLHKFPQTKVQFTSDRRPFLPDYVAPPSDERASAS